MSQPPSLIFINNYIQIIISYFRSSSSRIPLFLLPSRTQIPTRKKNHQKDFLCSLCFHGLNFQHCPASSSKAQNHYYWALRLFPSLLHAFWWRLWSWKEALFIFWVVCQNLCLWRKHDFLFKWHLLIQVFLQVGFEIDLLTKILLPQRCSKAKGQVWWLNFSA